MTSLHLTLGLCFFIGLVLIDLVYLFLNKANKESYKQLFLLIIGGLLVLLVLGFLTGFSWTEIRTDLVVEAHGLLFDIIFFGIIIGLFEIRQAQKREKEKYSIQLDSIREWYGDEAAFRVKYLIKKLIDEGVPVHDIDISRLHVGRLSSSVIQEGIKSGSKIRCFRGGVLEDISFEGYNYEDCDFREVRFKNCRFLRGDFGASQFDNSSIEFCEIKDVQTSRVQFGHITIKDSEISLLRVSHPSSISLASTNLTNCGFNQVSFNELKIRGRNISNTLFAGCSFDFQNSPESGFVDALLKEVRFSNCRLVLDENVHFHGASFMSCDFSNSYLVGSTFLGLNMPHSKFYSCQLSATDFTGSVLNYSKFSKRGVTADLHGIKLNNCELANCEFAYATIPQGEFLNSILTNSDFTGAYLDDVMFRGADLVDVTLAESSLYRTDFTGSKNLDKVGSWVDAKFFEVKIDAVMKTKLSTILSPAQYAQVIWV